MLHYTTFHILDSTSFPFYMAFGYKSLHIFQTFSRVFMSRQFPSHSTTGIPLNSWNVLVLLELWHGAISCIKIYSVGTQHIDIFQYHG